jgi:NADH-ubiquinone oxidoreductase chain 1
MVTVLLMKPLAQTLLELFIVVLPLLGSIAFMTLAERKVMGSMQRRLGPTEVGFVGLLQPVIDGVKLLLKEAVIPSLAIKPLFLLAPFITLTLSILAWVAIPFAKGSVVADFSLALLFLMAVSSLAVYGVLLAGWSANSKFAFLGSLRSTAQLVSYELPFATVILIVALLLGSLSLIQIVEAQQSIWLLVPLLPLALIWLIVILGETNRTPFDLPEAESELVQGFMVEHSALPFAFFFLGEYGSMLLLSSLTSILFLGGYLPPFAINFGFLPASIVESLTLGVKSVAIFFFFIWIRATLPRVRFDQLMVLCWAALLPLGFAFAIFVPSILVAFDITP